jgi:hypothetical protein
MGFRVIFKIDQIDKNERHTGYERDEKGVMDRSKPIVEAFATVRLSAVEPHEDKDRQHLNNQVWAGRISGNLVLTNVSMEIAEKLRNGHEYIVDVSPAEAPSFDAPATAIAPAPAIDDPETSGA